MFEDPVSVHDEYDTGTSEISTHKSHVDVVKQERMGSTELQSVLRALENELDIAEAFIEPVQKAETPIATTEKLKHNQCKSESRQQARKMVLNKLQLDLSEKPMPSTSCEVLAEDQHIGERRYCCHICKKHFTKKFTLIIHLQMHNKVKINSCVICNISCHTQKKLQIHMFSHSTSEVNAKMPWTRVVNYSCTLCHKRFLHESLSTNIRNIKGQPYICSGCHEILSRHKLLRKRKYACDKCSERFEDAFDLVMHKRSHASAPKSYSRVRRS